MRDAALLLQGKREHRPYRRVHFRKADLVVGPQKSAQGLAEAVSQEQAGRMVMLIDYSTVSRMVG